VYSAIRVIYKTHSPLLNHYLCNSACPVYLLHGRMAWVYVGNVLVQIVVSCRVKLVAVRTFDPLVRVLMPNVSRKLLVTSKGQAAKMTHVGKFLQVRTEIYKAK
jgi:hypothetical protein